MVLVYDIISFLFPDQEFFVHTVIIYTCQCPTGHKPKKNNVREKMEEALVSPRAEGIIMLSNHKYALRNNLSFGDLYLPPGFDFKVSGNLNVWIIGRDTADQVERSQLQEKLINGL